MLCSVKSLSVQNWYRYANQCPKSEQERRISAVEREERLLTWADSPRSIEITHLLCLTLSARRTRCQSPTNDGKLTSSERRWGQRQNARKSEKRERIMRLSSRRLWNSALWTCICIVLLGKRWGWSQDLIWGVAVRVQPLTPGNSRQGKVVVTCTVPTSRTFQPHAQFIRHLVQVEAPHGWKPILCLRLPRLVHWFAKVANHVYSIRSQLITRPAIFIYRLLRIIISTLQALNIFYYIYHYYDWACSSAILTANVFPV